MRICLDLAVVDRNDTRDHRAQSNPELSSSLDAIERRMRASSAKCDEVITRALFARDGPARVTTNGYLSNRREWV